MSSKLVIVIVIFCVIDLSVLAIRSQSNVDELSTRKPPTRNRSNKGSSRNKKPLQFETELPNIDLSSYHRISNARHGLNMALDVVQIKNEYFAQLNVVNGKFSQEWNFVPLDHGAFYIQNRFLGDGYALTLMLRGDQVNSVMVRKDNSAGQRWHFVSNEPGTYKLYNEFSGDKLFLDFYLNNHLTYISNIGPNDIGHNWIFQDVNPTDNY